MKKILLMFGFLILVGCSAVVDDIVENDTEEVSINDTEEVVINESVDINNTEVDINETDINETINETEV